MKLAALIVALLAAREPLRLVMLAIGIRKAMNDSSLFNGTKALANINLCIKEYSHDGS